MHVHVPGTYIKIYYILRYPTHIVFYLYFMKRKSKTALPDFQSNENLNNSFKYISFIQQNVSFKNNIVGFQFADNNKTQSYMS